MFDDYLDGLADEDREALAAVVEQVSGLVPEAVEGRSYGLPAFRYQGKPLFAFAAHKDHLSVYPFSPAVLDAVRERLTGFGLSKGAVRFSREEPIPRDLVAAIVDGRRREIDGA